MTERALKCLRVTVSRRCLVEERQDLEIAVPADATAEEVTQLIRGSLEQDPWSYAALVDDCLDESDLSVVAVVESTSNDALDLMVGRDEVV